MTSRLARPVHAIFRRAMPFALLAASIVFGGVFTFAQPAAADDCVWYTDQDIVDTVSPSCRATYLADNGVHNLLSRAQLLAAGGYYSGQGYSRQFLWYSREQTVHVPDTRAQLWTGCTSGAPRVAGNACAGPPDVHPMYRPGGALKVLSIDLRSFAFGGRTIARACGNYLVSGPGIDPVPSALVEKYDDRNRNGTRDPGEAGLAGWQFRVERIASTFHDQNPGVVGTVTSGAGGTAEFRFDGHGPGTYAIEELGQDGWAPTTAPRQTFVVSEGAGDDRVAHLHFGNAQTRADLAKVDFGLVGAPQRLDAHVTAELTVRAEIRNNGPADVTATDTIDVTVPADCRTEPAHDETTQRLTAGQSIVVEFRTRLTCDQPSYHPVTFTDHLRVGTLGVEDPVLENNTRAFEWVVPVFDRADVQLSDTEVHCPARADITEVFECTLGATVRNAGPYGPVTTDVTFGVRLPEDCRVVDSGGATDVLTLQPGHALTVTSRWRLTCAQRSFHDITGDASAVLRHLHVEDPIDGNATGTATSRMGIFEPTDLSADVIDLRCTERESNVATSACTATFRVTNHGPATGVAVRTALTITPEPDCTAAPSPPIETQRTIAAGGTTTVTATWQLACTGSHRHSARVDGTVATDEPHAEDRWPANNRTRTVWGPGDVKPRSLPSSINISKEGVVPFALLSTPILNALNTVDRASLRFGRTGTESSGITCAANGEDVNDDGRLDLICRAETQRTGITCTTTELLVVGQLADGTRFQSEDTVKVTGCH